MSGTIKATRLRQTLFRVLREIALTGKPMEVTRRGKTIAVIVPKQGVLGQNGSPTAEASGT